MSAKYSSIRRSKVGFWAFPSVDLSVTSALDLGASGSSTGGSTSLLLIHHLGGCSCPQDTNNDENNDSDAYLVFFLVCWLENESKVQSNSTEGRALVLCMTDSSSIP